MRILEVLSDAASPLDVKEIAERIGTHPNTVRGHVRILVGAGLLRAERESGRAGRPRTVYALAPDVTRPEFPDEYRRLATMLAATLAALPDASNRAEETGRRWGRYLVERPPPFVRVDPEEAAGRLLRLLDAVGFEPELEATGDGVRLAMHRCPFHDTAAQFQSVVCSLHLGIMRGALEELGAPVEAVRLQPFVEPDLCLASLERRSL